MTQEIRTVNAQINRACAMEQQARQDFADGIISRREMQQEIEEALQTIENKKDRLSELYAAQEA